MMNNCDLYMSNQLISKMNKSTLETKDTKVIDIPQLGHGLTIALCSEALEGYPSFEDSYQHHRFYCLMRLFLQWQLIKIPI